MRSQRISEVENKSEFLFPIDSSTGYFTNHAPAMRARLGLGSTVQVWVPSSSQGSIIICFLQEIAVSVYDLYLASYHRELSQKLVSSNCCCIAFGASCLITGGGEPKCKCSYALLFQITIYLRSSVDTRENKWSSSFLLVNFQRSKKKLPAQQAFLDSPAQWPMQQWSGQQFP